jgi:glucokinase
LIRAGIDVGGTKILGVVLDAEVEVRIATPLGRDAVLDAIAEVTRLLGPVDAVGVGMPGPVDRRGVLRVGAHLPGLFDVPVADELRDRLEVPVVVDNDATCAAMGEYGRGAARGTSDAVVVTLGTGIGAGLIAGGELQRGAHGYAGEPGHMVVEASGVPCDCGRRGCWEQYASGPALARYGGVARGEEVTAAARAGDATALAALEQFASWVAIGLADLVNLLDPELVVISGGLAVDADLYLPAVEQALPALVLGGRHRDVPRVVPAELGARAGAIGAALLATRGLPA